MWQIILPILTAILLLFQAWKDWKAHETRTRRAIVIVAVIAICTAQGYFTVRSSRQANQDRERITALGEQLNKLQRDLKISQDSNVQNALEITKKLTEAQQSYGQQTEQTLRSIRGTAKYLHRGLGSLIPLNGFKFYVTLLGIKPSSRAVVDWDKVPIFQKAWPIDFPEPESNLPKSELDRLIRNSEITYATVGPVTNMPDLPYHLMCFSEDGVVNQVSLGVQLSEHPLYQLILVGNPRKQEESHCEITASLHVIDEDRHAHTIDLAHWGVQKKPSAKDSVTLWGVVNREDFEQQSLTNWLTMSSFEGSSLVQIRLSVDASNISSKELLNKIVADFRHEIPKNFVVEVGTGIRGEQELGVIRHLSLSSASYPFFGGRKLFVSFFYSETGPQENAK